MKKEAALVIVLLVAAVSAVAIYYWYLAPSPEGRSIKIGLVAPYSLPVGQDMDRAARMAVEEINDAGGVYVEEWDESVPIELVIADTGSASPDVGVTVVTKAVIDEEVDLLIGGFSSGCTLADQVVAIENRVPFIITGASTHLVTQRGPQANYGGLPEDDALRIDDEEGMSYMFHYCTTTYHYSKTVVRFFAEAMKPLLDSTYGFDPSRKLRLAVLYRDDAYGEGVWEASKHYIEVEDLPIEIVAEKSYPTTTTTFHAELTAIKDLKPDAVYVVEFTTGSAEIFKEGQKDVGLNIVYIAVECCEEPEFYTLLGEWGKYQLLESKFASYAGPPFYLPLMDTYVTEYEEKYDTTPGMMGADTYDAFYIAKDAIERAGTLNKTMVRDALEATNMEQMLIMTETGHIQFSTEVGTYHEIAPVTFVEQLFWDEDAGECRPLVVWPETAPVVGAIKQTDFVLPPDYEPGSP
jgi:branched-chain amino acid transport system substrate-binding protein